MILYTLGHTVGAVIATPAFGSQSDAVVSSMKSVQVVVQGTERTWYDFYRGFGAFVSLFFILSTWIAWYLGGRGRETRRIFEPLTWAFVLAWAGGAVLAWQFFFATPLIFSTVITVILMAACIEDRRTTNSHVKNGRGCSPCVDGNGSPAPARQATALVNVSPCNRYVAAQRVSADRCGASARVRRSLVVDAERTEYGIADPADRDASPLETTPDISGGPAEKTSE
jgi:hypothetical protein